MSYSTKETRAYLVGHTVLSIYQENVIKRTCFSPLFFVVFSVFFFFFFLVFFFLFLFLLFFLFLFLF